MSLFCSNIIVIRPSIRAVPNNLVVQAQRLMSRKMRVVTISLPDLSWAGGFRHMRRGTRPPLNSSEKFCSASIVRFVLQKPDIFATGRVLRLHLCSWTQTPSAWERISCPCQGCRLIQCSRTSATPFRPSGPTLCPSLLAHCSGTPYLFHLHHPSAQKCPSSS